MWFKKDINSKVNQKKAYGLDYLEIPGDEGAPTILLLHGFGADNTDLSSLSAAYSGKLRPTWILPNGPDKVQFGFLSMGRSWFKVNIALLQEAFKNKDYGAVQNAFPKEIKEIREKLEGFVREIGIPPEKLIVGGFSQGAVLATEIAMHAFERPLALLVFSGTMMNKESWEPLAHQKGGLHFFQSHGKNDPLLPIVLAEQLEQFFLSAGLIGQLYRFDGGHEIPQGALKELDHFLQKLVT